MCCKTTGWIGVVAGVTTLASVVIGNELTKSMEDAPGEVAMLASDFSAGFQDAQSETAPQAEATMTADEVLQRSVEASFGDAVKDRSVKRVRLNGAFEIAAMGVSGTIETMIDAERGEIVSITEIPGMTSAAQGITGGVAWANDTMQGPRLLTDDERALLARQANFYADVDFTKTYTEREYLGEEEVDGVQCHVISLTPADGGSPIKRWYSAETGLQMQQQLTIASPMGEVTAVARIGDWIEVDGIKMPARLVNSFSGIEQVVTFESLEINPDFDAEDFAIPAPVQELLDNQ